MKEETDKYGWPTTRTYPRTLEEAFPKDPQNSEWFFPPEKNQSPRNIALGMVALFLWVCICYVLSAPM